MLAVCLFKAATSEMFKYVVPNVQMSVTWWSPAAAMAVQAGGAASSPAQPSSTTGRRWARVSYSLMSPWREQRAGAVVVVPVQARSDTQTGRRRQRESAGTFRARQVGAAGSARSHTCIARSGDNPVKRAHLQLHLLARHGGPGALGGALAHPCQFQPCPQFGPATPVVIII